MKRILCVMLALTALASVLLPAAAASEPPQVERAASAYLYNFENDTVLLEYEADKRIYPASTVKLMTGILALEALGDTPEATITVTAAMLEKVVGNNIGLKRGETVKVKGPLVWETSLSEGDAVTVVFDPQDERQKMVLLPEV